MKERRYRLKAYSVLPGFWVCLGISLAYMSLIVLIPLAGMAIRSMSLTWAEFWKIITDARVLAAYRLSFGAALGSALVSTLLGFLVAWVLVRYPFPGKRLIDAMVDLPFALPTAVSGITLTALFSQNGWLGRYLARAGIEVAFTPLGIVVALIFIGLPFVVRTLQPALEDLPVDLEEAAACLGAGRWHSFRRVLLPVLIPSTVTGFSLALARSIGEYGSVVFIAGNMPMRTEIAPLLIVIKLEQFDYAGATAIALVMLCASFLLLLLINLVQWAYVRRIAE